VAEPDDYEKFVKVVLEDAYLAFIGPAPEGE